MPENTVQGLHWKLRKIISTPKSHLDLGCNDKSLLRLIGSFKQKGLDIQYGNDLNIYQELDDKYWLITCVEVIEHLDAHLPLIKTIKDNLHEDGHCIITTPNIYTIKSKILFMLYNKFINFMDCDIDIHIRPVINNIFKKQLKDNKLRIKEIIDYKTVRIYVIRHK